MTSPTQESTVELIVDVKVVKIRKAPYRYLPDGTYDNKPLSPTYFRDYYRKTRKPHECPHCHVVLNHKDGLYKHNIRSKKCKKLRETLDTLATTSEAEVEDESHEADS